jgi:hypothetical protein
VEEAAVAVKPAGRLGAVLSEVVAVLWLHLRRWTEPKHCRRVDRLDGVVIASGRRKAGILIRGHGAQGRNQAARAIDAVSRYADVVGGGRPRQVDLGGGGRCCRQTAGTLGAVESVVAAPVFIRNAA